MPTRVYIIHRLHPFFVNLVTCRNGRLPLRQTSFAVKSIWTGTDLHVHSITAGMGTRW